MSELKQIEMTWETFEFTIHRLAKQIKDSGIEIKGIYGIPRGGLTIAVRLSHLLHLPLIVDEKQISVSTLIVDDVSDTGKTLLKLVRKMSTFYDVTLYFNPESLYRPKFYALAKPENSWIVFPWERK